MSATATRTRKPAASKPAPTKASKPTEPTPATAPAPAPYREAHAAEYAALKGAVQALQRQSYRHAGQAVAWAQPEHRTALGDNVPDNGTPMPQAMAQMIANARTALDDLERAVTAG